jgi:hypothetical protein
MNRAKANWRRVRALWPVTLAVLVACGGASDPAEDTAKTEEAVAATAGMESAEARRRNGWVYCAAEGATCAVPSTRLVRYGANGTYFYKTVSGSIACNSRTWGDPAAGVTKKCDYAASTTATAPTPAPVPTPAPAPTPTPTPAPVPATSAATLSWTASSSSQVIAYRVYYGSGPGSYLQPAGQGIQVAASTSTVVGTLQVGKIYYFAVTAVDAGGTESAPSNEVSKAIQ